MAKRFESAREPFFMRTPGGSFIYKRDVPVGLKILIGRTVWWIRLGRDQGIARAHAARLRTQHDNLIARLRTPAIRRIIDQEGGTARVRDAVDFINEPLTEVPDVPGLNEPDLRTALALRQALADFRASDIAERERLAPVVDILTDRPQPVTLSILTTRWLDATKPSPATVDRYSRAMRRLIESAGGDIPAADLTRQGIRDFVAYLSTLPEMAPVTAGQYLVCVKAAFS